MRIWYTVGCRLNVIKCAKLHGSGTAERCFFFHSDEGDDMWMEKAWGRTIEFTEECMVFVSILQNGLSWMWGEEVDNTQQKERNLYACQNDHCWSEKMSRHVWHHWFYSENSWGCGFIKRHGLWNMRQLPSLSVSVRLVMPLLVSKIMCCFNKVEVCTVAVVMMSVTVGLKFPFCWVFMNFTFKSEQSISFPKFTS